MGTSGFPGRGRRPLSLAQYVLGFFLLVSLALILFAGLLWRDLNALMDVALRNDAALAGEELEQARLNLERQAGALASMIADSDEARAQLEDPSYYLYWRDSRALAGEALPALSADLELYDASGKALAQERRGGLPPELEPRKARAWLCGEEGQAWACFVFPLLDLENQRLLGHVAMRYPLPGALLQVHAFHHLDVGTLRIEVTPGTQPPYTELARHASFAPRPNPYVQTLRDIARRSAVQLAFGTLVALLLAYAMVHAVALRPLRRLIGHLGALQAGRPSLLAPRGHPLPVREMELLREALNDYQVKLEELHGDLATKNTELWRMAHHDPLTGVHNRRAFEDDWHQAASGRVPAALPVSLTLFDCDHFKAINDTYGHHVGDQVIQALARCLRESLRAGDRLYRLGGDEFATVLWNTPAQEAARLARRCLDAVAAHDFTAYGVREPVRVSAGIAEALSLGEDTREELQRRADVAMYEAKRPGSTKVVLYSDALENREVLVSHPETHAVWRAMSERERVELHYQPVVNLPGGELSHYEALLRIRDGERLVMPSTILPLVEMRGCECELDLAVVDRLGMDLSQGRIPAGAGVAVNISGPGIVDPRVLDSLLKLVPFLPRHRLIVEITETSLITRIAEASGHLRRLRDAGFLVALDDFGNGYSSLRYLAHMPVDYVKFDREMVQSLTGHDRQALLVRDLSRLIRDAGYRLVAEGIESEEMLAAVRELGFDQAQGWHLGRPQPFAP